MNIFHSMQNDNLKCGLCNMPLSIPPVVHTNSFGYICGRCENDGVTLTANSDGFLERQFIYEKIARHFIFPCAFHIFGCKEQLKWINVSTHEESCKFKNILCVLSDEKQCDWKGDRVSLISHLRKDHKDYFSNSLELRLTKDFAKKIMFFNMKSHFIMLIFEFKKDLNKYFCYISADMEYKFCFDFIYRIEISTKERANPVILQKDNLEYFYGNIETNEDNSLQINVNDIKYLLDELDEVNVRFIITKRNGNISEASNHLSANFALNKIEYKEINEELLRDLECPICNEYMKEPIFICQSGHNVCGSCKNNINNCPLCRGPMLGGRNFTLEKLTATINYPCSNREQGCGYVEKLIQVREHEQHCIFSKRKCFVEGCEWEGPLYLFIDHMENNHNFLEQNKIHFHLLEKKSDTHILYFDEKLFILNIRFNINQSFDYDIIYLGEGKQKYKYEFVILGSPFIDIKITLSHLCRPLAPSANKRDIEEFRGISIPFSFLSQFVTQFAKIEYKIKIIKMNE